MGGLIAGWIVDYVGRKAALMLVGIPYLVGYLMMVYARFINHAVIFKVILLTGRFLTGVGLGWTCLATPVSDQPNFRVVCHVPSIVYLYSKLFQVYLAEISSSKLRGVFASFTELFVNVGLLLVYLLGSFESFQYYDSSLVLVGIVAIFELSMVFLHETPRWLLAHKQKEEAVKALKFLRGTKYDIHKELTIIENDIEQFPKLKTSQTLLELGKRKVLLPLLIICFVMFFQQIGGLNASIAYPALIFKEAQVEDYRATSAYAIGGVGVVFAIIATFIVDVIGRKTLLIISGIGMLISTITLGTFFYITRAELCANVTVDVSAGATDSTCNVQLAPMAIASLILFNGAFSIGWGPIPWILLAELIPLRVRGVGSGIATFVNWGAAAIVTGFYLDFAEAVNAWFAWWIFSALNVMAILFVMFFVFETKGKNLEDIQHRFDSKH